MKRLLLPLALVSLPAFGIDSLPAAAPSGSPPAQRYPMPGQMPTPAPAADTAGGQAPAATAGESAVAPAGNENPPPASNLVRTPGATMGNPNEAPLSDPGRAQESGTLPQPAGGAVVEEPCCPRGRMGGQGGMGMGMRNPASGPQSGDAGRASQGVRDPTVMSNRFRDAMKQMVPPSSAARGGGSPAFAALPKIRLAGKSMGGGRPPSIMLQVEERTYMVRVGDQVSLLSSSREPVTVRVESITQSGVQLLILPNNQRLFLD